MISRSRAVLISSALMLLWGSSAAAGGRIGGVTVRGTRVIAGKALLEGTYLDEGAVYTDSLRHAEIARIDSVYFSRGLLGWSVAIDTSSAGGRLSIGLDISEGERAVVERMSISGAGVFDPEDAKAMLMLREGDRFDPLALGEGLKGLLLAFNDSGYPFAQVWLTGFSYDPDRNTVDISVSISSGVESTVTGIRFDGLAKTDSSFAARLTRLETGVGYSERRVGRGAGYLRSSGYFESVGEVSVRRREGGDVLLVIPVTERENYNSFQGAGGFSKRESGDYVLSGSVEVELSNIAGTGRNVSFEWLNDGRRYSEIELRMREPFLLGLPVGLDVELGQIVQDTLYTWHSAGLYCRMPLTPRFSIIAGAGADRNVPGEGDLLRAVRQRYRLGVEWTGRPVSGALHAEGAYKRSYYGGNRAESEGQFLYRAGIEARVPAFRNQHLLMRFVSEGVLSGSGIHGAERISLGGAGSLRGYRENQFRGERTAYANIEYRFGEEGRLFLFDDLGIFYNEGEDWILKNGLGFGIWSASPLGIVELSFGVGEEISLSGTRIHILLRERF